MKYLLDTDTCIFALRASGSLRERFGALDPASIAVSVVTLAELRYSASCSARPEANHRAIDDFANGVPVLGLDEEAARTFGEIKARLRNRGALIDDLDLLIAATAHRYRLTLVTHNIQHFARIDGLQLEDWVRP